MNFFKKAQEFAASSAGSTTPDSGAAAATETPNQTIDASAGGFGSLLGQASSFMNATQSDTNEPKAAPVALPGGRQPPTTQELMASSQLLFGAAQGQKVDNTQLAGAAEDLLGGLTAYGKLDQGQYSTYVNQAQDYLHKYSGGDAAAVGEKAPITAAPTSTETATQQVENAAPSAPAPAETATPQVDTAAPTTTSADAAPAEQVAVSKAAQ